MVAGVEEVGKCSVDHYAYECTHKDSSTCVCVCALEHIDGLNTHHRKFTFYLPLPSSCPPSSYITIMTSCMLKSSLLYSQPLLLFGVYLNENDE